MASGEWVFSMDADERVSPELQNSILKVLQQPKAEGYWCSRRNIWLGHVLRGGHWYPDRRIRLARKKNACWVGLDPHDQLKVQGKMGELSGDLIHIPYRNLLEHLKTIDRYTALSAAQLRAQGKRARWIDLWLRPLWRFFSAFVLAGGWKDGLPGLMLAILGSFYCALKWARVKGILD